MYPDISLLIQHLTGEIGRRRHSPRNGHDHLVRQHRLPTVKRHPRARLPLPIHHLLGPLQPRRHPHLHARLPQQLQRPILDLIRQRLRRQQLVPRMHHRHLELRLHHLQLRRHLNPNRAYPHCQQRPHTTSATDQDSPPPTTTTPLPPPTTPATCSSTSNKYSFLLLACGTTGHTLLNPDAATK